MAGYGILRIPEWMLRFAYLNVLWIFFSLLGLFILGFFPATISMFVIIRKWLMGDTEIPVFKTFWSTFKMYFYKANLLGLILVITGLTLYFDIHFLQQSSGFFIQIIHYFVLIIAFIYLLTLLYVFPVFVHYDYTIFQGLKHAFLYMIISPLSTLMMIAGSLLFYFIMTTFIGLLPILGGSLYAFLIMWSAYLTFSRIDQKKTALV